MITQRAGFGEHLGIAQIPHVVLTVISALVVAVIPTAIAAVTAALEMPAWRMRGEGYLAGLAVPKEQPDIAAFERLDWSRRVPAKLLVGALELPSWVVRLPKRQRALATDIAV